VATRRSATIKDKFNIHQTMTTTTRKEYTLDIYKPEQQGSGAFDGGKITEIKPIPFPQESGGAKRTGPLLYWAWASAKGDGIIGMHPHKGFEIISYVMEGSVGHTDTAGNNRRVSAGGIQVMQTGSGISHREEMYGERTEFFQIWFEPNMETALKKAPVYSEFEDSQFPRTTIDSNTIVKHLVGPNGAAQIDAPIEWNEVTIETNGRYSIAIDPKSLAAMVLIEGEAQLEIESESKTLNRRDFAFLKTQDPIQLTISTGESSARFAIITAPLDPRYPLIRI